MKAVYPPYRLPGGRAFKFFRDEVFEFLKAHPVAGNDELGDSN